METERSRANGKEISSHWNFTNRRRRRRMNFARWRTEFRARKERGWLLASKKTPSPNGKPLRKKRRGPVQQAPPETCSNAWKLRSSEGDFQSILQLAVGLGDDSRSEPGVGTADPLVSGAVGADDVISWAAGFILRLCDASNHNGRPRAAIHAAAVVERTRAIIPSCALDVGRVKVRVVKDVEEVHAETHPEPLLNPPVLVDSHVPIDIMRTVASAARRIANRPDLEADERERVRIKDLVAGY